MPSRSFFAPLGNQAPASGIWQEARRIQAAASDLGFDWKNLDDILEKLVEESGELLDAQRTGAQEAILDELGDVLFVVSHYAWRAGIALEDALAQALAKFQLRFGLLCEALEEEGLDMRAESIDSLEKRWQDVKSRLAACQQEAELLDRVTPEDRTPSRSTSGEEPS
ncbi:MazG family protein [mine drainage metagenome]|uniref:MazG family protein n=1 Tax=mine drainage metagenome TaxID=410659 RepID=T1CJ03_9ZZZZ